MKIQNVFFYAVIFYGGRFFENNSCEMTGKKQRQNSLALHNECEYLWLANTFGNLVCMARKQQIWILIYFEAFGKKIIVSKLFSYSWFEFISFGSFIRRIRWSFSLWRQWQSHKISEWHWTCMPIGKLKIIEHRSLWTVDERRRFSCFPFTICHWLNFMVVDS